MVTPLKIFISYAHIDESFKERLLSHLAILRRRKLVKLWQDRCIDAGSDWRHAIDQAMADCTLALLLVSDAFLNSEFIDSRELQVLLERRQREGLRVVPLILRPCAWTLSDLESLQALPRDGKPIVTFPLENGARDQAWTDITYAIADWAQQESPEPNVDLPLFTPPADQEQRAQDYQPLFSPPGGGRAVEPRLLHWLGKFYAPPPQRSAPTRPPLHLDPPPAGHVNPFNPWEPAHPPHFYGREELLRRLRLALDEGRSLSLVGDRRIGKSSLLAAWRAEAARRGRVVRWVDGDGPDGASCAALVAAITGQPAAELPEEPDAAADQLAAWVADHSHPGLPPLLLLDEMDHTLLRLPPRFLERLRGLLDRLCLVLATRQEVDTLYQMAGLTSPFTNRLEHHRLGLLEPTAAQALIASGDDLLTPQDRTLIDQWAGRHPYFIALLGRHLWDARSRNQGSQEALALFSDEAFTRLQELWRGLDERSRTDLSPLASGQPARPSRLLERRGLLLEGAPFGLVLRRWLEEEQR